MHKRSILTATVLILVLGLVSSVCFGATTIRIAANIGEVHQMDVVLNKVVGTTWTLITNLLTEGMDFGSLTKGTDNVFRSDAYFVVDAPVTSNRSSWTITHTRTNFQRDTTNNLNNNTNVKFMKVNNATDAETLLSSGYVSYENSNNKIINSADLVDSRLRIYYSIAAGSGDASGVSVITTDKPSGAYAGTVTLTLSP